MKLVTTHENAELVKGVNGRPMNPKDENKVIGPGKPNEVNNNP